MKLIGYSTVKRVEHRFEKQWVTGIGKDAVFREHSIGWFLSIEGSTAGIFVGEDEPSLKVGDQITISIEKRGK